MGTTLVILVIVVVAGWFVWRSRRYRQARALRLSFQGRPKENVAHNAFAHGNTCLMEGKFDDARVAFYQVLELEPKHSHVAGRLAEVERQQAASAAVSRGV